MRVKSLSFKRAAVASLVVGLYALHSMTYAEKADKTMPMNAQADELVHDDLQQKSVFKGKVIITKGSIVMRGASIEVRQDPQGYQYAVISSDGSGRAFFRQKREGVNEYIEGEAQTIEYDGKTDKVRFINQANLRRLDGATLQDSVSGSVIVYDNVTERYTVESGAGNASTTNPKGRVSVTMSPKSAPNKEKPAAVTLQPSDKIGGSGK